MKQEQNQLVRLDWVLEYLKEHAGQGVPQGDKTWNEIAAKHPSLHVNVPGNENESYRKQIFDKIEEDKYLTIEDDGMYWITIKGLMFKGYVEESQSLDLQKSLSRTLMIQAEKNAKRLNYLTAILGVATAALAISEVMKIYTEKKVNFCQYIDTLLLSTILIILVLLFSKKAKRVSSSNP